MHNFFWNVKKTLEIPQNVYFDLFVGDVGDHHILAIKEECKKQKSVLSFTCNAWESF